MTDKTKGLKIKDITGAWVEANFDVDKERKTKTQAVAYERMEYIIDPGPNGIEFDEWLQKITEWFEQQSEGLDCKVTRKIRTADDSDLYSDPSGGHLETFLEVIIPEDDSRVINRIKNREKQKIRRRNDMAAATAAKAKKIAAEKKLLRQLMIKYKGEL